MYKSLGVILTALSLLLLSTACEEKKPADDSEAKATATAPEAEESAKPAQAQSDKSQAPAPEKAQEEAPLAMIEIPALAELSKKDAAALAIFDANGDKTREKMGVIPGATLLTDYAEYDTSKLPEKKDTKLVFYCANEMCKASHKAANRAASAGYSDVAVLPAGIKGWKASGQPTVAPAEAKKM